MALEELTHDLLVRVLAGAGGAGVARAAAACKRLAAAATELAAAPLLCSAMSTLAVLGDAVRDATLRALEGSWGGGVDFALLLIAGYARPKKYRASEGPVEVLAELLGRDVPVVGAACAGLMGVAPGGPAEVDPQAARALGRRAAQHGVAVPTRGVAVLLGRLPKNCTARAFASHTWVRGARAGMALGLGPPAARVGARAASARRLPTAVSAPPAQPPRGDGGDGGAWPFDDEGAAGRVRAAEPRLCLLLHRANDDALDDAVEWFRERHPALQVVGGLSSGAGDLLFAPGGPAAADAPRAGGAPVFAGLLLCSTDACAAPQPAGAGAAAGPSAAEADAPECGGPLRVATMSARGLATRPGADLFAGVRARVVHEPGQDLVLEIAAGRGALTLIDLHSSIIAEIMMHGVEPCVALWCCPAGEEPAPFTGEQEAFVVFVGGPSMDGGTGPLRLGIEDVLAGGCVPEPEPGGTLCLQVVAYSAAASAAAVASGLSRLRAQLLPAGRAEGRLADCYAAAAAAALAAGARSGTAAVVAFSCTGRGQALYCEDGSAATSFGAVTEAKIIDQAFSQAAPFVGAYVDGELGPALRALHLGGAADPPEVQGYTSMFGGWAFEPA
ncbi:hypothetical protein HT031_000275 [Scenedesmus sp. PABB004]|nr:hypothetical protein HT031_000275 [Scenedesmus sp. PABB004]